MRMAVTGGTCRGANIAGWEVCGKTGTAQNPHGRDHSAFMGFAPMSDPKIAVAVYVENAGFGATFGVPIGAVMMEQYLNGKLSPAREAVARRMENTSLYSAKLYGGKKQEGSNKKQDASGKKQEGGDKKQDASGKKPDAKSEKQAANHN